MYCLMTLGAVLVSAGTGVATNGMTRLGGGGRLPTVKVISRQTTI